MSSNINQNLDDTEIRKRNKKNNQHHQQDNNLMENQKMTELIDYQKTNQIKSTHTTKRKRRSRMRQQKIKPTTQQPLHDSSTSSDNTIKNHVKKDTNDIPRMISNSTKISDAPKDLIECHFSSTSSDVEDTNSAAPQK
jgi:hypothetical protein